MKNTKESELIFDCCKPIDWFDTIFAFIWPALLIIVFCFLDERMLHWFVLPLYLCGVIVGFDAIRWCRGKMDTFDPKGLIGLLGMHFFVLAPLLVVYYNAEKIGEVYITDWRPWLGAVASYSFIGLIFYNIFQKFFSNRQSKTINTYWALDFSKSILWTPLILGLMATLHLIYVFKLGGLSGFINVRTYGNQSVSVTGWGPIMVLGRSLPIVALITITIWKYRKLNRTSNIFVVGFVLFIFLIIQFLVTGLTGSRSATLWGLFWAVGIIHFFWRKIPKKWILVSLVPFILFMYLYSFYKTMGAEAAKALKQGTSLASLSYESGRTFSGMLIGDFSRADVQAAQFYILKSELWPYRYRFGSTYPTSVVPLIPRKLWPTKPPDAGKVIAGTEMIYGPGAYQGRSLLIIGKRATRIYGLAGEAMLNFGIWGIVPAFAVWGYLVGFVRRRLASLRYKDLRLLIIPFWVNISFLILVNDMSNHAGHILYKWLVPALLIFMITSKVSLNYFEQPEV